MIEVFYKSKGQIVTSSDIAYLDELGFDDVLWIENEEEDCYEVIFSVLGTEIVSLYELVYTTLYVEN